MEETKTEQDLPTNEQPVDFSNISHVYEYNVKKGSIELLNQEMPAGVQSNFFSFNNTSGKVVKPQWDSYELEWWATQNHTHRRCIELKATLVAGFGYDIRNKSHRNYKKLEAFLKKPNTNFGDTSTNIFTNIMRNKSIYGSGGIFTARALDVLQMYSPTNYKSIFVEPVKRNGRNTTKIKNFVQLSRDGNRSVNYLPYDGKSEIGKKYMYRIGFKTLQNSYYPEPEYLPVLNKIKEDYFVDQNNIDFFRNRARMDMVIIFSGGKLQANDKTAIKNRYQDDMSSFKGPGNQHKTMVLEAGEGSEIKIHDLAKNEDGQYSVRQGNLEVAISRAHGIMPSLLTLRTGGSGFGGGSVAVGDLFLQNQIMIRPEQVELENAINLFLEAEFGFDPDIKFKTIDNVNQKDMAIILSSLANLGIIGKIEGRKFISTHGLMDMPVPETMPDDLIEVKSGVKPNADGDARSPVDTDAEADGINTIDEVKSVLKLLKDKFLLDKDLDKIN